MERAQGETENRTQELDEIKKNVSVKERFKEKSGPEEEDPEKRKSHLDEHPIDTTCKLKAVPIVRYIIHFLFVLYSQSCSKRTLFERRCVPRYGSYRKNFH